MMRNALPVAVLFLLVSNLPAAPEAEDEVSQAEHPVAQQPKPTSAATTPNVKPVKNFTPTEKVGADSAVSFPVDI